MTARDHGQDDEQGGMKRQDWVPNTDMRTTMAPGVSMITSVATAMDRTMRPVPSMPMVLHPARVTVIMDIARPRRRARSGVVRHGVRHRDRAQRRVCGGTGFLWPCGELGRAAGGCDSQSWRCAGIVDRLGSSGTRHTSANPGGTYGWGRSTILASLTNAVVLLFGCGAIAVEAVRRFNDPAPVGGSTVMWVAAPES